MFSRNRYDLFFENKKCFKKCRINYYLNTRSRLLMNDYGEILIYQSEDGLTNIEVKLQDEAVWLTQ